MCRKTCRFISLFILWLKRQLSKTKLEFSLVLVDLLNCLLSFLQGNLNSYLSTAFNSVKYLLDGPLKILRDKSCLSRLVIQPLRIFSWRIALSIFDGGNSIFDTWYYHEIILTSGIHTEYLLCSSLHTGSSFGLA